MDCNILQRIKISSKKRLSGKNLLPQRIILTRFLQVRTLKLLIISLFVRWRVDGLLLIRRWGTTDLGLDHRFSSSCCIIKFVGIAGFQDGGEIVNSFSECRQWKCINASKIEATIVRYILGWLIPSSAMGLNFANTSKIYLHCYAGFFNDQYGVTYRNSLNTTMILDSCGRNSDIPIYSRFKSEVQFNLCSNEKNEFRFRECDSPSYIFYSMNGRETM